MSIHEESTAATDGRVPSTTRGRLDTLLRLVGRTGGLISLHAELEAVAARIEVCSEDDRLLFEEASLPWRAALDALINALRRDELDQRYHRDMAIVAQALSCLSDHITDTKNAAKLRAAQLRIAYRRTDLAGHTRALALAFRSLAQKRSIAFSVDLPDRCLVDIDPEKFEIVVLHLLFNAFKYTPPRGGIRLTLNEGAVGDEVILSVVDSGPGIPLSHEEALFDRGRQLDRSTTMRVGGLGFSLGTSRDLVALHGGALTMRQTPGRQGCTFRATFPTRAPGGVLVAVEEHAASSFAAVVARAAEEELLAEERIGGAVKRDDRPLVLIVEDSRTVQRILINCLEPAYATASSFDGADGLEKAITLKPDVIITDVMMPELDGESMVNEIRKLPDLCEIPIIVLTALDDPARIVRLLEAGVQDVLRKPFLHQEVRARVGGLAAQKRARDILNETIGRHEENLIHLAAEVSQRQRKLETALEEVRVARDLAESASRIKSNFLRMMSHELKTPIAAMQLQMRVLERDPEIQLSSSAKDGVARIARSSRRLLQLIDTVMEWARVESGRFKMQPGPLDLNAVVDDVMAETATYAHDKGIAVLVHRNVIPTLNADMRVVRLLILNMLTHALQATEQGTIEIDIGVENGVHRIKLRDSAASIPPEWRHEIFSPLQADVDLRYRAGSGSGLGLHVVRDIARAIGGDVSLAEPEPGQRGNVFVLTLAPPAKAIAPSADAKPAGRVSE